MNLYEKTKKAHDLAMAFLKAAVKNKPISLTLHDKFILSRYKKDEEAFIYEEENGDCLVWKIKKEQKK